MQERLGEIVGSGKVSNTQQLQERHHGCLLTEVS